MMRINGSRRLVAVWIGVMVGCGDNGPSTPLVASDLPSSTAGSEPGTLTIVSGETGEPLSGAVLHVAGREYVADPSGRVSLDRSVPTGASLDARMPGFLFRETLVRAGETSVEMWPTGGATGIDEAYTRVLVYTSAAVGMSTMEALERPALDTPRIALIPAAAIALDPGAMSTLRAAAAEMTDALGGAFVYEIGERPGAVPVNLLVEPNNSSIIDDNLRAFTRCWMNRLAIFRCDIVFRSVDIVSSETALHELGHTFGLNHSSIRSEIMAVRRTRIPTTFSPRERLVMQMLQKRPPGNLFPDNDRQAPALRVDAAVSRIVCRLPH